MTLVELTIAMTIMAMVVGTLGGLARTVQQSFEYTQGYGTATQHARVLLDRIAQNVCQATASEEFPGCIVVDEIVDSYRYPDTLVVWRPSGTVADPTDLPRYNELVIYCPDPNIPNQFVEMTAPSDTRTVPPAGDGSAWRTALDALKNNDATEIVVLSDLLRAASTSGADANSLRGAVRFETRLRPSATDWADYQAGAVAWDNLPWVQGIYGTQTGLRQVWVRTELQLTPSEQWISSNPEAAWAIPYFGSTALYYELPHP